MKTVSKKGKRKSKKIKCFSIQQKKLNKKLKWSLGGISDQAQ